MAGSWPSKLTTPATRPTPPTTTALVGLQQRPDDGGFQAKIVVESRNTIRLFFNVPR